MATKETQPSKSESYDQAVTRATGQAAGPAGEMTIAPPAGVEGMIKAYTPDVFAADIQSGKYEAAPQLFKLAEGQVIEGILEGNGPVAEFTDNDTGEVSTVKTWIIADPTGALRVSILSSAQLDRKLNGFVGHPVKIARGKDVSIQGTRKRMTEYMVWGPKIPGKKREWFEMDHMQRAQLEAIRGHRALPAGNGVPGVIDVTDASNATPAAS